MKNAQTEQPAQTFVIFLAFYFVTFLSVLKQTFKRIMQTEYLRKLLLNVSSVSYQTIYHGTKSFSFEMLQVLYLI